MNRAAKELVKEIAAELTGLDRKLPAEQLAKYFAIGHKLRNMIDNTAKYGPSGVAVEEVAARVPQLKSTTNVYVVRNLSGLEPVMHFGSAGVRCGGA